MAESVKKDKKIRTLGDRNKNQTSDGIIQSGVTNDDWIEFDASFFSYSSSNVITVSTIDISDYFQVGDKIKLYQNSLTKYLYIRAIGSTTITLTGGSDYSYTNHAITWIRMSRMATPFGFPAKFNWTPSKTYEFPHLVTGVTSEYAYFRMEGSIISFWYGLALTISSGTTAGYIQVDYPWTLDLPISGTDFFTHVGIAVVSMGSMQFRVLSSATNLSIFTMQSAGAEGLTYFDGSVEWVLPLEE